MFYEIMPVSGVYYTAYMYLYALYCTEAKIDMVSVAAESRHPSSKQGGFQPFRFSPTTWIRQASFGYLSLEGRPACCVI
jgi:hypothetical protein